MKRITPTLLLCLAAAAPCGHAANTPNAVSAASASSAASSPSAPSADAGLLGCWRAAKIVLYVQDGTQAEDTSGRCTLQFKQTLFESTCKTTTGTSTTVYRYQVVRPRVYAATMATSTFKTDMIGSTREYEYRIDGDRLRTVSVPPAKPPEPPAVAAPRVETEAARTPCL
ncbi:hypothetical protein LJR129_004810 [Acidovorax sp. LjRoot129]|uniref:hypothetical protein n=1 Tax=Acidovorax sp. LjRoot129 TaxID=3342260 RepID=UPI003ECD123A